MMNNKRKIITLTLSPVNQSGNCPNNFIIEYKHTSPLLKPHQNHASISTNTFPKSLFERKKVNTLSSLTPNNVPLASRSKLLSQITTPTKKEIKSITFGSASIFAAKIKKIKKLPLPDVTHNLMSDIQLLISSIKKEERFIVSSLREDAALMELTANFCIRSHALRIVSVLTKLKIFLVDLVSVHTGKT